MNNEIKMQAYTRYPELKEAYEEYEANLSNFNWYKLRKTLNATIEALEAKIKACDEGIYTVDDMYNIFETALCSVSEIEQNYRDDDFELDIEKAFEHYIKEF